MSHVSLTLSTAHQVDEPDCEVVTGPRLYAVSVLHEPPRTLCSSRQWTRAKTVLLAGEAVNCKDRADHSFDATAGEDKAGVDSISNSVLLSSELT